MRNSILGAYRIFLRVCHNLEPDITSDKGNKPKTVKGRSREGCKPGVATIYDYSCLTVHPQIAWRAFRMDQSEVLFSLWLQCFEFRSL